MSEKVHTVIGNLVFQQDVDASHRQRKHCLRRTDCEEHLFGRESNRHEIERRERPDLSRGILQAVLLPQRPFRKCKFNL